jgi:hypothetical protein
MAHRNLAVVCDAMGNSREAMVENERAIACSSQTTARTTAEARHADELRTIEGDASALRRLAVQQAGHGIRADQAHAHYDAYRALKNRKFVLQNSDRTVELLLKAKQDLL